VTAVFGVDPGVNGALAVLLSAGDVAFVRGLKPDMTETDVDGIMDAMVSVMKGYESRIGFFEKVQHMTGDGGQGSHTFGYIKGYLRAGLRARGMVLIDVYPQAWQAYLGCLSGGDKNVTKRFAAALFPSLKVTHGIADGLLVAEYGRQRLSL